jgi:spore maturation protein CgeB
MILKKLKKETPWMIWVEKGVFIWPSTLEIAKTSGVRFLVLYSPDNFFLWQNNSRHLWNGLPSYDIVVTTKTHNARRLRQKGAKSVFLSGNAYDPETHRPVILSEEEYAKFACDVSFVGRWEPEREKWLERVASIGVKLSIWGYRWERAKSLFVKNACKGEPVLGSDYAKAICGSKINLCLLSRLAKDSITQRSVEIPACGGFMLAERTEEHIVHFSENIEAAYFTGLDEMCQKIEYYLAHDKERQTIAAAGRQKCLSAGFSYDARIQEIFKALGA